MTGPKLNAIERRARALGALLLLLAPLQPAPVWAQQATASTPSRDVPLSQLRAESKGHEIYLERPRRLNVSTSVEEDLKSEQSYRKIYLLRLAPMQSVQLDLSSQELDTLLRAYDETGKLVAENDDWGGTADSRLFLTAVDKAHMRYFIVVTNTRNREGSVTFEMRELETPRSAKQSPLAAGTPVSAKLDSTSPLNVENQFIYDSYYFDGTAGERVKLVATPTDAPVGLQLRVNQDQPFKASATLPGRPVSIFGPLKSSGRVEVLVTGTPGFDSPYRLELSRLPPAQQAATPLPVTVGQDINNVFAADSPVVPGTNRPYALYVLNGRAGQSVAVSAELAGSPPTKSDSLLSRLSSDGLAVEIGVDTPLGFATVLQSPFHPPLTRGATFGRDGPVYIRVSAPTGTVGSYKLRVREQAPAPAPAATAD